MSPRGRNLFCPTLILAALSVYGAEAALGESVMIKREFVPGAVSYIENRMDVAQEISGLPMPPMKLHLTQLYGLWEKVESVNNEGNRIVLTFDRAARKTEAPMMGEVEFDTDDPDYEEAAPQLGVVLKPMIGMVLNMNVDKEGKVSAFTGMDAIHKKISEKAVASMHWAHMEDEFTDEQGKETWGTGLLLIYPNKKVKVGDAWTGSLSMERPAVGTIVADYHYRVDRIGTEGGRKVVSIAVTGAFSGGSDVKKETDPTGRDSVEAGRKENDDAETETKKPDPQTEVSGSMSGTAVYDVELGRIVKRNGESKLDLEIPLSKLMPDVPTGEEPRFVSFKMNLKTTILILTEQGREAQKAEARKKAELRKQAEEEDDDDEEEDDD